MKIIRLFILCVVTLTVAACGGGSSGSGSGGGGGSSSSDGVYNGTEIYTLSVPGVISQTNTFPITIKISGGKVTLTDVDGISGTAPTSADGKSFLVALKSTVPVGNVSCRVDDVYSGTISGAKITGTISGSTPCSGGGVAFRVTTSGTFSATQTGAAKFSIEGGKADSLKHLLDNS
jgi:hypothetical protein